MMESINNNYYFILRVNAVVIVVSLQSRHLRGGKCLSNVCQRIDHFTVVCLVAWPLNENEAGGDLVLIET